MTPECTTQPASPSLTAAIGTPSPAGEHAGQLARRQLRATRQQSNRKVSQRTALST